MIRIVWPLAVSRSNSRKACVIQITAVNENKRRQEGDRSGLENVAVKDGH